MTQRPVDYNGITYYPTPETTCNECEFLNPNAIALSLNKANQNLFVQTVLKLFGDPVKQPNFNISPNV